MRHFLGSSLFQVGSLKSSLPAIRYAIVIKFFEELRRRMKFRVFDSLDDAEACVSEVLEEFYNDAARVKSLTLFPYITYARNSLN